ncbi:MAG: retropepsin-like aspartic protease [Cyanobacteria bacterium J06638_28]
MGIARYLSLSCLSFATLVASSTTVLADCGNYVSYWETPDGECINLEPLTRESPSADIAIPSAAPPNEALPSTSASSSNLVARLPIVGRDGGTPIVLVTLTGTQGTQQFPMLFDTGATGTQITSDMAQAVGVDIQGQVTVIVADGRQVPYPAGYVGSLEAGGLTLQQVPVWVGGGAPLLGQNVYGQYSILINPDSIELYQ